MKRFLFLALLTLVSSASSIHALEPNFQALEDQALVLQDRGNYEQSLELWKQLQERYEKAGLKDKAAGATVQIALTQESLGLLVPACYTLRAVLNIREKLCVPARQSEQVRSPLSLNTANEAIAAINLARILKNLGAYDTAMPLADAALTTSKRNGYTDLTDDIAIARGAIQGDKLRQSFDQWQFQDVVFLPDYEANQLVADFQSTFQAYELAFNGDFAIDAKLKWLQLYQDLEKQAAAYQQDIVDKLRESRRANSVALMNEISSLDIQDFHKFGLSEQLRLMNDQAQLMLENNHPDSYRFIQELIDAAHDHPDYLAFGYGLLGDWYQGRGDREQAIRAYHQASILGNALHPLYQWQYQIAHNFEELGNERQAERFYESAIALIDQIQRNISPVERSLKLHFQESIRPIYDDYSRFQLGKDNPDIAKVFKLRNQYSEQVVENYLGCGKLQTLSFQEITQQDPDAAYVSIFKDGESYYTLLKQGNSYFYKVVDAHEVEAPIHALSVFFGDIQVKPRVPMLNTELQKLYASIFKPIEAQLIPGQTVVFMGLEPELQQIPMASLFDGEQYLTEKHPVNLLTNSLFAAPKTNHSLKTLFVGLSEQPLKNFSELPYVAQEAQVIGPSRVLLNEQFTQSQLTKSVQADVQVLHIATHGQFSSDPNQTFLLAWDQKLSIPDLKKILKERAINQSPIDLLILSACETAKGDRLAAMGLAGISIESGAQTTVASIWQALDASSPFFMERFYFYLRSGKPKAKAVQLAQIDMIKQDFPPYSWATYILTGNWL